ncbi:MAG: tetratricopeptide repeat protein [Deltaproteobacteria bacterium]|nr:tetratricopeptide repeat protein [Deltaproteobacteria bacterium]
MIKPGRIITVLLASALVYGCAPRAVDQHPMSRSVQERMRGVAEYGEGNYQRALERFTEALRIDRATDDRKSEALDLVDIGRVYIAVNDAKSARGFLAEAVRLSKAEGHAEVLSEAYATLAKAELMEGDNPSALRYIDESIATDASLSKKEPGGKLNLKAAVFLSDNRVAEAVSVFERALSINEAVNDEAEAANSLRGLGDAALASGGFDNAFKYYEAAYEKDKRLGLSGRIARDLSSMAEAQLGLGRKDEALYLLERSYHVGLSGKDTSLAARSLERMISVFESAGNIEKARSLKAVKEGLETKMDTGETLK